MLFILVNDIADYLFPAPTHNVIVLPAFPQENFRTVILAFIFLIFFIINDKAWL